MFTSTRRIPLPGKVTAAVLLGFAVTAFAGPDYRTIAFHPVPLTNDNAGSYMDLLAPVSSDSILGFQDDASMSDASVDRYRASISELELTGGPFNVLVAQQTEALGDLLSRRHDPDAAIKAFEKSLHILRINEGLYSAGQERLLHKIIDSHLALNQVDKAHEFHQALLHQQMRLYDKGDAGYIAAILAWADWNVDRLLVSREPVVGPMGAGIITINSNLVTAQESYLDVIEQIRASGDMTRVQRKQLVHAEKKLAAINYIANSQTTVQPNMQYSAFDDGDGYSNEQRRAENAGMAFFFNGSSALKRAITYSLESPQPDYLAIAEQMMVLGDWYLLFDRRAAALAIYEDAFEVLDAVQATEADIQRIMTPGMPVSAPDAMASDSKLPDTAFAGYIDVEFQVSKFGVASKPEVIAASEELDSPVTTALIRKIRQEKFRPAFVDGSAASGENIKLRYYYSYN